MARAPSHDQQLDVRAPRRAFMYVHGTLIDQNLKNAAPDYLGREKVLVERCWLLVADATV